MKKQKRGQVSIFLLIAVIFFIVLVMLVYPRLDAGDGGVTVTHGTELDLKNVEEYIKQTLTNAVEESLQEIQDQGFVYNQEYPTYAIPSYNGKPVAVSFTAITDNTQYNLYPYEQFVFPPTQVQNLGDNELEKLCDSKGENAPNIHAVQARSCERELYDIPNTPSDLQSQIRRRVKKIIKDKITEAQLQTFVFADYEMQGEPVIEISLTEKAITAIMKWKITGSTKETTHTVDQVTATVPTRVPLMYTLMYKIAEREAKDIMFDTELNYKDLICADFAESNNCADNLYVERNPVPENGYYEYTIKNVDGPEELTFYIKNRNPVIEDFPVAPPSETTRYLDPTTSEYKFEYEDGEDHEINLNIKDPDDKEVTDIQVINAYTAGDICYDIFTTQPYATIDTKKIHFTLNELPDKNEDGDSSDEDNDGDCTLSEQSEKAHWCFAPQQAYGWPGDSEENDLHCEFMVRVIDENNQKDEAIIHFTIANDEYNWN